jgi:hypothetical protein
MDERDERQVNLRSSIETYLDDVKTGVSEELRDQSGGNHDMGRIYASIEAWETG